MATSVHKCGVPIIAEKVGGLSQVKPCGKLAIKKSADGKRWICPGHVAAGAAK